MRRFFFDPKSRNGDAVRLSAEQARHAVRVLRLHSGAPLELLDGLGTVYRAVLRLSGDEALATDLTVVERVEEEDGGVWVAQGMLRGEKMAEVVQRCTELGVNRFIPLTTARCQGRLSAEQGLHKLERWRRISREACKQCRRPLPMQLTPPSLLADFLADPLLQGEGVHRLLFWEEETDHRLRERGDLSPSARVVVLLGPEGGLNGEEAAAAVAAGFRPLSLGPRILRAETATLAGVAIVQHLLGEM